MLSNWVHYIHTSLRASTTLTTLTSLSPPLLHHSLHPYFMPWWKSEFLLVLQMIRSAHWTTTMLAKKLVWQLNSMIFLCS